MAGLRASAAGGAPEHLWVRDGRLYLGPGLDTAQLVRVYDHALLYIDVVAERDDWQAIASIGNRFDRAQRAAIDGDSDSERLRQLALLEVFDAVELTALDKN